MVVPEFMRFYGYTRRQFLGEYAIAFFALVNSMYQLKARERMDGILEVSTGMAGEKAKDTINKLERQSEGLEPVLREVRAVKEMKR